MAVLKRPISQRHSKIQGPVRHRRRTRAGLYKLLRDRIPGCNVILELALLEFNETFLSEINQEGGE